MQLTILKKYESKALDLCYIGIDPAIGIEWCNNVVNARIEEIAKPATQVQVVFAHERGGQQVR